MVMKSFPSYISTANFYHFVLYFSFACLTIFKLFNQRLEISRRLNLCHPFTYNIIKQ